MTEAPRRSTAVAARVLAALLGLLGFAAAGYAMVFRIGVASAFEPGVVYRVLMAATGLVAGVLAVAVAVRGRGTAQNTVFALFLGFLGLAASDEGRFLLLRRVVGALEAGSAPADGAQRAAFLALVALGLAATLRVSQLFPAPLTGAGIAAAPGWAWLRRLQVRMLGGRVAWLGVAAVSWLLMWAALLMGPALAFAPLLVELAVLALATSYLRVAYATGDAAKRRRILWLLEAGVVVMLALALAAIFEPLFHAPGEAGGVVRWGHALAMPLGLLGATVVLGFGVLYSGALDPRLVVRRTLLYGGVGIVMTLVFVGVEVFVEEVLADRLGLPDRAGGYVAGIMTAFVLGPVHAAIARRLKGPPPEPV